MLKRLRTMSFVMMVLALILSACGNNTGAAGESDEEEEVTELGQEELTLPYVSWATAIASVNVAKPVLEDIGYNVDLRQVEAGAMFAGLADGSADLSVGTVSLPTTHADYWDEYEDQVDDVGATMKNSVTMGLTVPEYVDIDSIEDMADNKNNIGEKTDWTIVGIDPGAGEMVITENEVMPGYGLDEWDLQSSSGAAMTAKLKKAIDAKEPVIVTLWEPHWAFLEWDLKYLDEPENYFGEPDSKHAVAREGLEEDAPAAYQFMEQFEWDADDMGEVMQMIHNGMEPEEAGKQWIEEHPKKVAEWTKGLK